MKNNEILTKREREVINKKLNNLRLNQQDSNYLSRFVRPKLKAMRQINPDYLLNRLNYNPKSISIDKKIKNLILKSLESTNKVKAIILYGSIIQTGYQNYNDIDVLVITKEKIEKIRDRIILINKVEKIAKKDNLILDIQIISEKAFLSSYSSSPTLIYQLKDSKIIYGKIKIPNKINLSKMDLRMKLDWSDIENIQSEQKEIYNAIRNTFLVKMLMNRIINNYQLSQELIKELGNNLIKKLKSNTASKLEKKWALQYLNYITNKTREEVINAKWEKIEL
jgi:predicted nucleotidyltransferase